MQSPTHQIKVSNLGYCYVIAAGSEVPILHVFPSVQRLKNPIKKGIYAPIQKNYQMIVLIAHLTQELFHSNLANLSTFYVAEKVNGKH